MNFLWRRQYKRNREVDDELNQAKENTKQLGHRVDRLERLAGIEERTQLMERRAK